MSSVIEWLQSNLLTVLLLLALLLTVVYAVWLRYRMLVSKARFALAVVAAMVSCVAGLLAFLSGPLPIQILNAALSSVHSLASFSGAPVTIDGPNWLGMLIGFVATVAALFLIYKFAQSALITWEGPVTVNVNELAKYDQDNSISSLALSEIRRLLAREADPIASEIAVNWQQRQSEAPAAPPWHVLARQLFEAAFPEAIFSDSGWRGRLQVWIGEMYVAHQQPFATLPMVLLVFENEPDDVDLRKRLDVFAREGASPTESKVFAIFNEGRTSDERNVSCEGLMVEVWPRQALLKRGLNFTPYARDLIKRFNRDVLGGTTATLQDTFVDAHVMPPKSVERESLDKILIEWLEDRSRRHLAITGEYGQGKSTAMLAFCMKWAGRYLANAAIAERVPLLIELRGQSPAEIDPVAFLSSWAGRYGLAPKQLFNLIRAGEAVLIFEGFDELRNAGRAYDRHEHFNALWRFAYPGTKLIFTGRPNFFLDEQEKNRTLRADAMKGAAGNAFTQLWQLDRLNEDEIRRVLLGFGPARCNSIMKATKENPAFLEIVSRPSMLPVVATIWDQVVQLQSQGQNLTSSTLLENYLQAIYRRKEEEIESDRRLYATPEGASYLLLPREVREVFTLAVVWRMADTEARNTISRASFNGVVAQIYDEVFRMFQRSGVPPHIGEQTRSFEERFREETRGDRLERVSNEVASAGVFVSDPAGGPSNLRLPHKQFYEYMIAKVAWIVLAHRESLTAKLLQSVARDKTPFESLLSEDLSLRFFADIIGSDFSVFHRLRLYVYLCSSVVEAKFMEGFWLVWRFFTKSKARPRSYFYDAEADRDSEQVIKGRSGLMVLISITFMTSILQMALLLFLHSSRRELDLSHIFFKEEIWLVFLFVMLSTGWVWFRVGRSRFAAWIALRRIVFLKLSMVTSTTRLSKSVLYLECLRALFDSPYSRIAVRSSDLDLDAQQKLRDSIAPIA